MEKSCKFCEYYFDVQELIERVYPFEEGLYCEKCILTLDKWTTEQWEAFMNDLVSFDDFTNDFEYQQDYMLSKGYRAKNSAGED